MIVTMFKARATGFAAPWDFKFEFLFEATIQLKELLLRRKAQYN
jgi:hypothetical protein